jgi:hypothetical protein|tara:strand:+ start:678 stop:881 length:204 start_codon:yes stop_codon:yes gene_type:complete
MARDPFKNDPLHRALEPGISEPQTSQMKASGLQLVVPRAVQNSYTDAQKGWLWSVEDFIRKVRTCQG